MAISNQHPLYIQRKPEWIQIQDTYQGSTIVKGKRTTYLPATDGMVADGMNSPTQKGSISYESYLIRSVYHEVFSDGVDTLAGIMHRQPPKIKLPKRLEGMRDNATAQGESLELLLRRINLDQLKYGRLGLLLEVPDNLGPAEVMPFIAFYDAQRIINWDFGRREQGRLSAEIIVLNESEAVREGDFTWQQMEKYRVLVMSSQLPSIMQQNQQLPASGAYMIATTADNNLELAAAQFLAPSIGGRPMDHIPFVIINTNDLVPEPQKPPLLGLSNLALALYRGEADYRQALFNQAQETLVKIGVTESDGDGTPIGTGTVIDLPIGGDAKFIGVSGNGLGEMRQALENDKDAAKQQGSRMLSTKGGDQQSGQALNTRVGAMTATLKNIAVAGAEGLERSLKDAAVWVGANPDEVEVVPNLDFSDSEVTGQNLLQMTQAMMLGAPISKRSFHQFLQRKGMTEKDYDEEIDLIEEEMADLSSVLPAPAPPKDKRGV